MNLKIYGIFFSLFALNVGEALYAKPAQKVGTQFLAAAINNVDVFVRAQPNCTGAVGPQQYVEYTNQNLRSFNKITGKPDGILDIDAVTLLGIREGGDSMLTFDRWGQRWIMVADLCDLTNPFPGPPPVSIALAWSDGPVITKDTKWTVYQFSSAAITPPVGAAIDSPKLSSDANAVYVNLDTISLSDQPSYLGVSAIIIPQSSFVEGNPFNFTVFPYLFNPNEYPEVGGLAFAPSPDNYDQDPEFGYIVVCPSLEVPGFFTYDNYLMLRIINPGSSNPVLYPSAANPISLEAPVYTDVGFLPHKGNLYGANGLLQNYTELDYGMPHIRNKQLYFVNNGLVNAQGVGTLPQNGGDRSAILWYHYDLTGDPTGQARFVESASTVPALVESGVIFDSSVTSTPLNYWNGAIMTDKKGNIVIIGNITGQTSYIQAFYTGRKVTDPLGILREITLLTHNTVPYNFGTLLPTDPNGLRWGDYCSLKPDPFSENDVWATSQIVAFQDGWGVLTTQLLPC